jgi:hypothetical protein
VVVEVGPEWKLLAQSGPEDISCSWRRLVAGSARVTDRFGDCREAVVAPLASTRIRAMLVVVPRAGTSLPSGARRIVRPLLHAGGILLDATVSDGMSRAGAGLRLVPPRTGS